MSYTSLTYHLVFSTRYRIGVIDRGHEKELYKFMFDFASRKGIKIRRIGGMPDHVHILCDIPANIAVSDFVRLLKSESSKFMKINENFPLWDGWTKRYAAFSVDASLREVRRQYIMHQREHHSRVSFADEMRQIFIEVGLDPDTLEFAE